MSTKMIGDQGEEIAATYLEEQGYHILERNYRFEHAELDIVCFEPYEQYELGGELVFVEVKTRSGLGFGQPEEAVDEPKKKSMAKAAEAYMYERQLEGARSRFDVISVLLASGQEPKIEHFKHAF